MTVKINTLEPQYIEGRTFEDKEKDFVLMATMIHFTIYSGGMELHGKISYPGKVDIDEAKQIVQQHIKNLIK